MAQRQLTRMRSSLNIVDEEYSEALHTKSFVDIHSRVQDQLNLRRSTTTVHSRLQKTQSSPQSYRDRDNGVPAFLFDPRQESLIAATLRNACSSRLNRHLNKLLLDFFDATLEASAACISILSSIDGARSHHRSVQLLLHNLSLTASPTIFSDLSSHLELDNPLSSQNLPHFHQALSRYPALILRLASTNGKITQRLRLIKLTKKASGIALLALLGAAVVAAASTTAGLKKPRRLEGAKARVDAAAKGSYIVGKDLDTMSQMLRRIHDEVEHERDVVRMVLKNREWDVVMREVVKEMGGRRREVGLGLEEQLEELEEHVYLCLITINRSRRLVEQEVMMQEASMVV